MTSSNNALTTRNTLLLVAFAWLSACAQAVPAAEHPEHAQPEAPSTSGAEPAHEPSSGVHADAMLGGGSCDAATRCSKEDCLARNGQVHRTCDQPRSCKDLSAGNTAEIMRRKGINMQCAQNREAVQSCFATTDGNHQAEIDNARASADYCDSLLH